jgi:hypothetical protein
MSRLAELESSSPEGSRFRFGRDTRRGAKIAGGELSVPGGR